MTKKAFAILFMSLILSGNLLPTYFTIAYWVGLNKSEECIKENDISFENKIKNNGDKYLLALLKRTCQSNESKNSKASILNFITVVQVFESKKMSTPISEEHVCNKVTDHYLNLYCFLFSDDFFHPPSFVV